MTLTRLLDQPDRYRAGVISGAPLVPIPEMLDADTSFDLDPHWLSNDPFYLDSLENDPLAFVDADGAPRCAHSTPHGIGSAATFPA